MSPRFSSGCLVLYSKAKVCSYWAVCRVFWLQLFCFPALTQPYLALTQSYLVRELPGEQDTDLMIIFHPCSVPYAGRTGRKKNISRSAGLLRVVQALLFHVDIWNNAPFPFPVHLLCPCVTRPTPGQSHMPFRCTRKAVRGLGMTLSTSTLPNWALVIWPACWCMVIPGHGHVAAERPLRKRRAVQMACLLFLFPCRNPCFYYCYFITVIVLCLNLAHMPRWGLPVEEIDFRHDAQEHRKCFPRPHSTLVFTSLLLPELRRALSSSPKWGSHHTQAPPEGKQSFPTKACSAVPGDR